MDILYGEHKTDDYVKDKINSYAGHQEPRFSVMKHRKPAWCEHVTSFETLSKIILQRQLRVDEDVEIGENLGIVTLKSGLEVGWWSFITVVRVSEDRESWAL